ncbi:F5/8 type C domain protein [[Clostridium] methylpentosum DSM 5476]|uniref:alpha-L-fucosidase n=1 Tax=[Clostridium] methylpentosum DSM 5476 TaxID=537013 RepID=C0EAA4_9FIRM|nr:F5/8 type C domain protein [[Clostridium] methylpentosum DSM 5476]
MPIAAPLTTYAAAIGEPLERSSVNFTNRNEALKCSVLLPYINGDDVIGSTLTGQYTLSINSSSTNPGQNGDVSTYQWYIGDTRNGEYTPIDGETARTYAIKDSDLNKYIRFEVTPKANGLTGKAIKSDPVGPIMSEEEFAKISPRLKKTETYMESRNNLTSEITRRFSNVTYFTVDEKIGGTDNVGEALLNGSIYYYKNGTSMSFNEAKPEVVDGVVMVNKAFVTNVLDAPDYDFAGKDTVALDDVAAALNKQVFYATEALKEGANGNYRSTAQAEGLIVISDNPLDVDVVADRDVLNEMANQVYNLRATEEEMQWFHDAKLGMFIHWDPGTMTGSEIGWGRGPGPRKVTSKNVGYDLAYLDFDPTEFDAQDIVAKAKEMGCKYLIFTSKHHGGFASWNTNYFPEHSIMGTPYGQRAQEQEVDIVKQLAAAAHAQGLKFGLYYSPQDWYNNYCWSEEHYRWMETYLGHLTELMGNYGEIDVFWCDAIGSALTMYNNTTPTGWKEAWGAWDPRTILRRVKQLQPGIITNDRYVYRWEDPKPWDQGGLPEDIQGDYITPEQTTAGFDNKHAWESCLTIDGGNAWSYNGNTGAKDPVRVTGDLINNTVNDGNVLLNMGLMWNGQFSSRHADAFAAVGQWAQDNAEAVYNTRGGPYVEPGWGGSTYRNNPDGTTTLYLHVSPKTRGSKVITGNVLNISNPPDGKEYTTASLLGQPDVEIGFEKTETGYTITLPEGMSFADGRTMETIDTIIKLEENLDAAIENAVKKANNFIEAMDGEGYPAALTSYRSVIEAKRDALSSAEGDDAKKAALSDIKTIFSAFDTATAIYEATVTNTELIGKQIVGSNSWELAPEMKASMEGRIEAAIAALTSATVNAEELTRILTGLNTDAEYLRSLANMTVVTFNPDSSYIQPESAIKLHTDNPDLAIYYTLDGTEPTAQSKLYTGAITAPKQGAFQIKAAVFSGETQVGVTYQQYFFVNNSEEPANLLSGAGITCSDETISAFQLAKVIDGNHNTETNFGAETNSLTLTFDLGAAKSFNTLMLYENYYIGFNEVRNVTVESSEDGVNFTPLGTKWIQGVGSISFDTVKAQYVRVSMPACQGPILQEIELYNVQKPDMSYLNLTSSASKFIPGAPVDFTVNGEINDAAVNPSDVVYVVEPAEAGVMKGNTLRVSKDFEGAMISVTATVENGERTVRSNTVKLTTGANLTMDSVKADNYYSSDYVPEKAFDGIMTTRWATKGTGAHWIDINYMETGYNRFVIREYLDDGIFRLPGKTRLTDFKLQYKDPNTGEDVIIFDSANQTDYDVVYDRTSPTEIFPSSDPNLKYTYVDANGDIASTVHEFAFAKTIPSNNIKLVSDRGEITFWEIEAYGSLTPPEPPASNKTILNKVIEKAEALLGTDEFNNAIQSVQDSFQAVLAEAKDVAGYDYSTQEEIDAAWVSLMTEIHKLGLQQGNKDQLREHVELYSELNLDLYLDGDAKDNFVAALEAAKAMLENNDAVQSEVDAADDALVAAAQALVKRGDKTTLQSVVDSTASYVEDHYAKGWAEFAAARDAANVVLENPNVTQEEVDAATDALIEAMLNLRLKADKSLLNSVIAAAEALDLSGYTKASVEAFEAALNEAKATAADESLSVDEQNQVTEAVNRLSNAVNNLKKADGSAANLSVNGDGSITGGSGSAKTGEATPIAMAMAALLLAGSAIIIKKRK